VNGPGGGYARPGAAYPRPANQGAATDLMRVLFPAVMLLFFLLPWHIGFFGIGGGNLAGIAGLYFEAGNFLGGGAIGVGVFYLIMFIICVVLWILALAYALIIMLVRKRSPGALNGADTLGKIFFGFPPFSTVFDRIERAPRIFFVVSAAVSVLAAIVFIAVEKLNVGVAVFVLVLSIAYGVVALTVRGFNQNTWVGNR
jgi:hypothetical protein